MSSIKLAGVMPPVPTPFDPRGEVAPGKLEENLHQLLSHDLAGFVIQGSNGEYVYLDEDEKATLFKAARRAIPKDKLFIAGTGAESTRATLRITTMAANAGADAAIVITPAYYKPAMGAEAQIKHFTAVADGSPIPVIIYNMPSYAGIDLTAETILKLAEHPNIIGIKESSPAIVKISEITGAVKERGLDFAVLAGSASYLQPFLMMGATGGVLAAVNVAPDLCSNIYKAVLAGQVEESQSFQQKVMGINAVVTTRFGVAGLKFIMDRIGLYGGPVRPPLLPLSPADQEKLLNFPLP